MKRGRGVGGAHVYIRLLFTGYWVSCSVVGERRKDPRPRLKRALHRCKRPRWFATMSGPQRRDDPTLLAPWQALFDPGTGFTYYWNPQTNVTQYDRPAGSAAPQVDATPLPPPPALQTGPRRRRGHAALLLLLSLAA